MSKLARLLSLIVPAIFDPASVRRGEADWFARLSTRDDPKSLVGGGVLVGDGTWVLTAAHVVESARPDRVHLKAYSRRDLKDPAEVTGTCVHPDFPTGSSSGASYLPNDLALLKIDRQGPALRLAASAPTRGTTGTIYGWGRTEDGMRKTSKRLNKNKDENEVRIEKLDAGTFEATSMACTGDSGGPFVVGGEVVGIYKGDGLVGDCSKGLDRYTAVFFHRTWIDDVMAGRGRCKPLPA